MSAKLLESYERILTKIGVGTGHGLRRTSGHLEFIVDWRDGVNSDTASTVFGGDLRSLVASSVYIVVSNVLALALSSKPVYVTKFLVETIINCRFLFVTIR